MCSAGIANDPKVGNPHSIGEESWKEKYTNVTKYRNNLGRFNNIQKFYDGVIPFTRQECEEVDCLN